MSVLRALGVAYALFALMRMHSLELLSRAPCADDIGECVSRVLTRLPCLVELAYGFRIPARSRRSRRQSLGNGVSDF